MKINHLPQMGSPTPYADKIGEFQAARSELVSTSQELLFVLSHTDQDEREKIREAHRLAELKLLKLYDDLLTKLQRNNILP